MIISKVENMFLNIYIVQYTLASFMMMAILLNLVVILFCNKYKCNLFDLVNLDSSNLDELNV